MAFPDRPRTVITGAGSGLGRALAFEMARRGGRLLLSDIDEVALEATRAEAEAAGAEVVAARADVARFEDVAELERLAQERWGGTDVLVNNAGVAVVGAVGEVSLEDWRWQLDVNLWGVIHGCHAFAPTMRARGAGHILNVASAAGLVSMPEMAPYNVSKSGVVALTRSMRAELSGAGVEVSVLCPTFFRSGIHTRARASQARLGSMSERLITEARWTAEEVASVALRGLERGKLHVLPQLDARVAWQLQRLWPAGFQWLVTLLHRTDVLDRLARRRRSIEGA